jgi:hypothetical protein
VVEVRNGEGASHHRYSQALTLRQFVLLQSGAAAPANDKCAVFVSANGQYACAVRDNQRKYHPALRCVAVAWEVRAASHGGMPSGRLLHSCSLCSGEVCQLALATLNWCVFYCR